MIRQNKIMDGEIKWQLQKMADKTMNAGCGQLCVDAYALNRHNWYQF